MLIKVPSMEVELLFKHAPIWVWGEVNGFHIVGANQVLGHRLGREVIIG